MKNKIIQLFESKPNAVLSVFYTAGFPTLESTVPIAASLAESGADLIEIGIPFSDPVADGPTIQASNKVALDNGMNLKLLLEQVKQIRAGGNSIPIILMGYLNPVLQYGVEAFVRDAANAGADGLILPDLPLDEYESGYRQAVERAGLCIAFLISPTTSEQRIRRVDSLSKGFIYAVSASSTTGAKGKFSDEQHAYFERLGKMKLRNPVLIGFGISGRETFEKASQHANGAIVGSAFINMLTNATDIARGVREFVAGIRGKEALAGQ